MIQIFVYFFPLEHANYFLKNQLSKERIKVINSFHSTLIVKTERKTCFTGYYSGKGNFSYVIDRCVLLEKINLIPNKNGLPAGITQKGLSISEIDRDRREQDQKYDIHYKQK